ncbi:MAG: ABC transporter ATP-binding protein/permease [Defluviitaleaceae bacterium]|nr:ABC transporter ATP-binding protein/permease [Defluviitaleaceae bacterium]
MKVNDKSRRSAFARLFLDNKRHWPGLFIMVLLALLAGVFKTRAATLWGEAVDFGVGGNTDAMLIAAVGMLIFIGLDGLRTAIHYTVIGQATEGMFRDVRMALFGVLSRTDTMTVENHMRSGDIALRVCEDTERLCDIIAGNFSHFMRLIFQAVFAIVVCVLLSWQLAIAYFLLLPVSLWILNAVSKPLEKLQKEARGGSGQSADVTAGAISGIHAVKVFGLEDEMEKRFAAHVDGAYQRFAKAARIGMGMTTVKYVVSVLQTLILFIVGAWLVAQGLVTIGAVMAFVSLAIYVTEAFGIADRMIFQVKSAAALSGRIYEVLDLPLEYPGDPMVQPDEVADYVKFDGLDFAYIEGQNVLSGLNLVIQKGQKVAIVGPSGSGKSTIIKLICRLYGYDGGQLTLFGKSGEAIDVSGLRENLALVTQEPCLFEGSILDNVRYGRMSATDGDVVKALQAADLWGFVSTLPDGIHTHLGEFGSRLSGGQRQRLSIARALIKNAKLVLLDEATSALDTQSEREIQQALDNLLEGRAAIIVAHRLTTVQKADYLYCLDNGTVIEEGTPEALFTSGGYYYNMCKMQELTA